MKTHWLTAASAASSNSLPPDSTTFGSLTFPEASTVTSRVTLASRRSASAAGGYVASLRCTTCGRRTASELTFQVAIRMLPE